MKLGVICMVSNEWRYTRSLFLVHNRNKSNKLKVNNKNKNNKFLNSQHPSTDMRGREGGRKEREGSPEQKENACAQRWLCAPEIGIKQIHTQRMGSY